MKLFHSAPITILLCSSCLFGLITESSSVFVDPYVVLQDKFEGWGTSLAWWADVVGGMDAEVQEYIVDALFSPSKLNLNIVRYVIGGTSPNNHTCGAYRDGAASESFKDGSNSSFIGDRDLRQRKILELAKDKGVNVFEAFSNTPPQWLTISGCSKGNPRNPPLHPNFDSSNAPEFADYATEVIKYFHEVLNITFTSYSPFNEPFGLHGIGSWAGAIQSQEGCNMDRATMVEVIKSVSEAAAAKNLSFLKIAVSEETQVNTQIQSYDYFVNAGISNLFQQVNVHGYWDNIELSRKDLLSARCDKGGHELWMDEMGWAGTPIDNMEQGLNIANRIVLDLRSMLPSAWVYWQAVEDVGAWGLIDVPFTNGSIKNVRFNSGYYAMEQFSQHIKQGYSLIYISDENSIAAFSKLDRKLIIVMVNAGDMDITREIDLTLFTSIGSVSLYRTSSTEQHIDLPPPTIGTGNEIAIQLSPNSISTLEFSNVEIAPVGENLIENSNFEDVIETPYGTFPAIWNIRTMGGETLRSGVTEDAWRGDYSGLVELGPTWSSSLIQNLTLEAPLTYSIADNDTCSLYLTAWCSSTHAGTMMEVYVNGDEVAVFEVNRNGAYTIYGVSFSAPVGSEIKILFWGSATALLTGAAKIDNVTMHAKC